MSVVLLAEPLGNLVDFPVGKRRVERVGVRSDDLAKRVLRLATGAGEFALRFDGPRRLCDGDVLYADDQVVVAAGVLPDDVLVMRPPSLAAAIELAHAIGDRHIPIQRDGDAIVVRYDPFLPELAGDHGVPVEREDRVVTRPFLHPHAPHDHG